MKLKKPTLTAMPLKTLVLAMASVAILPAHADTHGKKIGDLEIYQEAKGGKVTITMMLDTSGSMSVQPSDAALTAAACELPVGVSLSITSENSGKGYTRNFCYISRNQPAKRSYVWKYVSGFWTGTGYQRCADDNCSRVYRGLYARPWDLDSYHRDGNMYYVNVPAVSQGKYPDRLTRLKDAIFTLMDHSSLIEKAENVQIGIGQFSSQGGGYADGISGRIVVPAKPINPQHRQDIKNAVARFDGVGGTPAANAYAEVGAYMLGSTTKSSSPWWGRGIEGSGFDKSVGESKAGSLYKSPIKGSESAQCDGNGIYFLTDGEPNSSSRPEELMKIALGNKNLTKNGGTLLTSNINGVGGSLSPQHGMDAVGYFAKNLRDGKLNGLGYPIKTAVVGFGSVFDTKKYANVIQELDEYETDKVTGLPTGKLKGGGSKAKYFDCNKITEINGRNACNWGAKSHKNLSGVGGFGEGGFYSAQDSDAVVNSVLQFIQDLNNEIPASPSGTIVVPDDPYRINAKLAYAYMPFIQPQVGKAAATWPGNMKKYKIADGTLVGSNNKPLFKSANGDFNTDAADLWSPASESGSNQIEIGVGGMYAHLAEPTEKNIDSVRNVYVEDNDKQLRKIGISKGKFTVDGKNYTSNSFTDKTTFTKENVTRLINFLGFSILDHQKNSDIGSITFTKANLGATTKVLGASTHSTPSSVSYAANIDTKTGEIKQDGRDDYVLFGSADGALHFVDADKGDEKYAVIPKQMLTQQPKALSGEISGLTAGVPYQGVDAPWTIKADYKPDENITKMLIDKEKGIQAYGGLRMGGTGLYSLDLDNKDKPVLKFNIQPSTTGFDRLGHIWAKPTLAKIKRTSDNKKDTEVRYLAVAMICVMNIKTSKLGQHLLPPKTKRKTKPNRSISNWVSDSGAMSVKPQQTVRPKAMRYILLMPKLAIYYGQLSMTPMPQAKPKRLNT
ncbi:pilus assembly protein [Moraxella macacae]|uniref:PilC/PilY family type IV pilus protein n=1 Tax=Moraxella macacae TaxID=765840 RepID=UPI0002E3D618|nr:PilC/PilY family type IV pilus protein [Moraxella macacae]